MFRGALLAVAEVGWIEAETSLTSEASILATSGPGEEGEAAAVSAVSPRSGRELAIVLDGPVDTPLDAQNVFRPGREILGGVALAGMGSPDLRRTFAMPPRSRKVPPRVVMETTGHAQIGMTMRYSHVIPEARREVAEVMERALAADG